MTIGSLAEVTVRNVSSMVKSTEIREIKVDMLPSGTAECSKWNDSLAIRGGTTIPGKWIFVATINTCKMPPTSRTFSGLEEAIRSAREGPHKDIFAWGDEPIALRCPNGPAIQGDTPLPSPLCLKCQASDTLGRQGLILRCPGFGFRDKPCTDCAKLQEAWHTASYDELRRLMGF